MWIVQISGLDSESCFIAAMGGRRALASLDVQRCQAWMSASTGVPVASQDGHNASSEAKRARCAGATPLRKSMRACLLALLSSRRA